MPINPLLCNLIFLETRYRNPSQKQYKLKRISRHVQTFCPA